MKYYLLKRDHTDIGMQRMEMLDTDEARNSLTGTIDYDENQPLCDYIESPQRLVSDRMRELFKIYTEDLDCKSVVFTDIEKERQFLYWRIDPPQPLEILHETTIYSGDQIIEKLVINKAKADLYSLFQIKDKISNYWIVNLALAESLLRRKYFGFEVEEIELL